MEINVKDLLLHGEQNARKPHVLSAAETGRATDTIMVPDGFTAQQVKLSELPKPLFVRQNVITRRIKDFVEYIAKYRNPDSFLTLAPTVAFNGHAIADAVLDYHRPSDKPQVQGQEIEPEWGTHTVDYVPQIHPAYDLLTQLDGKLLPQADFAKGMKKLSRFLTSMQPIDLLELLRTFNVTTKGDFKSAEDDISGSVDFRFDLQATPGAGTYEKKITVPDSFEFVMPILYDGQPRTIKAELRFRAPEKGDSVVKMGLALVDREFDELAELDGLGDFFRTATGLLTVVGSTTNSYKASP